MIGIKINGEYLELYPDTRINLKLNNPIFADGNIIPGSYSLPFDIPFGMASEYNARIFNNLDVIDNTACQDKYDAELYLDHNLYKKGQVKVSAVSDTKLTTHFIFGFQTIQDSIKQNSLKDIITSNITLFSSIGHTKTVTLSFDIESTDVAITINGNTYSMYVTNTGDAPTSLVSQINDESATNNCVAGNVSGKLQLQPYANPTDINTPFNITGNPNHWVVEHNHVAYHTLVENAITPYFDEGNEPNAIIRFPMFKNTGAYSSEEHYTSEVNGNTTDNLNYNIPGGTDAIFDLGFDFLAINNNSLCPMIKLSYVLDQISTFLGITFTGDFMTSTWHDSALLFNTNYLDIQMPYLGEKSFIFYKYFVALEDHLPDMKINDFLKSLQTRFNLAIYYDEAIAEVNMSSRNTIIANTTYTDITDLSSTPRISDVSCRSAILLKSDQPINDDLKAETDQILGGSGEQEVTISTKCTSVSQYEDIYNYTFGAGSEIPVVNQEQSAKVLRLVFEHYEKDQLSGAETFYTADIEEPTDFYHYDNMYDDTWSQWISFLLKRKTVQTTVNFQLRHLLELDFNTKYRIAGINYFIKSVDTTLTMNGINPSKAELYST